MTDNQVVETLVSSKALPRSRNPVSTIAPSRKDERFFSHGVPQVMAILIIALAAWVRFAHLGTPSLPHDEAFRANWWHHGDSGQMRRFPPLQLLMGWSTQHYLDRSEWIIRLPYACCGIASVVVLYCFCRRYFGEWPAVVTATVAAGHPVLVHYSRQAKVYALEMLLVPILIWAGLSMCKQPSSKRLAFFVLLGLLGLGLTFTSSLVIAAGIPLMFLAWTQAPDEQRASRTSWALSLVILAAAMSACYVWLSGCVMRDVFVRYYDVEEPVWPRSLQPIELAFWLLSSIYGVVRFTLGMSDMWPPLNWCVGGLLLLAVCAAMPVLWKRSRPLCLFAIMILLASIAAGAARLWPFGDIRHSAFLAPIVVIALGVGLSDVIRRLGRSPASCLLILACLLIPLARAVKATVVHPRTPEHVRPVFDYVREHHQSEDALFIYYAADEPYWFYWNDPRTPAYVQPRSDRGNLNLFAERFDAWVRRHHRVWFVSCHDWKTERQDWINYLRGTYSVVDSIVTAEASAILLELPQDHQFEVPCDE